GWAGVKIKVGKPHAAEDAERLRAVREAVGPTLHIMTDANQSQNASSALRLARALEPYDPYWLEEPLPADDISGHARLAAATRIPVAVGESMYSLAQFRTYLEAGAASIVQVDAARVGGITPWLKVA
ncbi:enolase C-terminal domain-like protein, partial [Streptomyces sp. BE20]